MPVRASKMKKLITASLLAVACIVINACAKNDTQNKKEDVVLKSYRLIDEQRTDEAIELLESELASDPDNYEYKITLASAYAHKGGMKVQKFVPAVSKADKMKDLKLSLEDVDDKASVSNQVNTTAINVARLLTQFAQFFEVYAVIPVINSDQATYIKHAIYLLNETDDRLKPEDALYRAILGIIMFKHILAEGLIGEFVKPEGSETCRFDLGNVNDTFVELGKTLIGVLNDIGYANDDQAKDLKTTSDEVADTVSNLTLATTSLMVIDEASSMFLQQAVIQHGFGKLIKCGGDQ